MERPGRRGAAKPFPQSVEGRQQLIPAVGPGGVQGCDKPVEKLLVPQIQGGDDQIVLGGEVFIEGHFGNAGLGQYPVDAGGVIAVFIKQLQRRCHEVVSLLAGARAVRGGLGHALVLVRLFGPAACRYGPARVNRSVYILTHQAGLFKRDLSAAAAGCAGPGWRRSPGLSAENN